MNEQTGPLSQRDALRRRVVEVALAAFHARGLRVVTMDDIAHALTMSKRTLYQLFADKEELLIACLGEEERLHRERLHGLSEETDSVVELLLSDFRLKMQELETVSPEFFRDLSRFPRALRHMEQRHAENARVAVEFLNRGVAQGLLRPEINMEILYDLLTMTFECARDDRFLNRYSPVEVFFHSVFVYFRGCTTLKGAALMDDFLERYKADARFGAWMKG